jgi:hypothetical protein
MNVNTRGWLSSQVATLWASMASVVNVVVGHHQHDRAPVSAGRHLRPMQGNQG